MALSNEVRDLVRREVDSQLDSLESLLVRKEKELAELELRCQRQITAWERWSTGLKVLLTATVGGSILGIGAAWVKVDSYIDGRVAARVLKNETMTYAIWLANSNRPRQALAVFGVLYDDFSKSTPSAPVRSYFYQQMLGLLAQLPDRTASGFVGSLDWGQLNHDPYFTREFITQDLWAGDPDVNQNFAFCLLKFADISNGTKRQQVVSDASTRFQRALAGVPTPLGRAPYHFALGMTKLVNGETAAAEVDFREAAELDPSGYRLSEWAPNRETFFNSGEFPVWLRVAAPGVDLKQSYVAMTDRFASNP